MKIRLRAAPDAAAAANDEMPEFLAGVFAVGTREVKILAGQRPRSKIVEVAGITEREVHDVVAAIAR